MNKYYQGVVIVLLAAFFFALCPAFAKFAYKNDVTVLTLLFFRFFLAGIALFAYLLITKQNIPLDKRTLLGLFFVGAVCYNLQGICYFSALNYIPASLTVVISFTYPTFTAITSCILDHEPITRKISFSLISTLGGLALIAGTSLESINVMGIALATAASLFYTTYVIMGNRILKKVPTLVATTYMTLFSTVGIIIFTLVSGNRFEFSFQGAAWTWIILLFMFSTFGILCFMKGIEILGPTKTSVLCTFEPLFGVVIAIILFQDQLTWLQLSGAAGVIAGAVMAVYTPNKEIKREPAEPNFSNG